MTTTLYKTGDNLAVSTEATDEPTFRREFTELLANMIEKGMYDGDWVIHLENWLGCYTDICCKLRGYKADVLAIRKIVAGVFMETGAVMSIDDRRQIGSADAPPAFIEKRRISRADNRQKAADWADEMHGHRVRLHWQCVTGKRGEPVNETIDGDAFAVHVGGGHARVRIMFDDLDPSNISIIEDRNGKPTIAYYKRQLDISRVDGGRWYTDVKYGDKSIAIELLNTGK